MKDQTREEPKIVAAAERRMHAWAMTEETAAQSVRERRIDQPHRPRLGRYITISREAGAGGSEIADLVGRELGWEVLDKNLLDRVADRFRLPRPMLELVDETTANWAYDILGAWMDRKIIPHEKYVVHLSQVVMAAARRGNVVFVGRGAHFMLPRDQGMAVRLIAPAKYRLARLVSQTGMSEAAARQFVTEADRGRRDFVERFFHCDIADPQLYDLVINVEHLGLAGAAECIVAAYRRNQG
jgi:hypothetical protein